MAAVYSGQAVKVEKMMHRTRAQIAVLPDERRLHLHDGPMDLIVEAFGPAHPIDLAYRAAAKRFVTVLDELCSELPLLRQPARPESPIPAGVVAKRMMAAVAPYCQRTFITPMAAVAGAVAEEILQAMTAAANLSRAYVNNGGDIGLYLAPGANFVVGMVERPDRPSLFGTAMLESTEPVRGIATSGWRGRSFSLGIADAVTVLAERAAMADAAATIIANAVDLPRHPAVTRVPARDLTPDSDLGDRLVTQEVGELCAEEIAAALDAGVAEAEALLAAGLIRAAALHLQGETRIVGPVPKFSCRSAVNESHPSCEVLPQRSRLREERNIIHA
ncbi:MAG TPA: UPF0280 family protein [Terriglobales bacterium]|jgi:ApbE superfamily uncharacterized protein (UPF0280 family)|nr:UPF0280 family protein [Terriglobales bacterium]